MYPLAVTESGSVGFGIARVCAMANEICTLARTKRMIRIEDFKLPLCLVVYRSPHPCRHDRDHQQALLFECYDLCRPHGAIAQLRSRPSNCQRPNLARLYRA